MGVIWTGETRTKQPQRRPKIKPQYLANVVGVWGPNFGMVGPVDSSGLGLYNVSRTDVANKYPLHGYYTNGSSELELVPASGGLALRGDGARKGYNLNIPSSGAADFSMNVVFSLTSVTGTQVIFGGFNRDQSPVWLYGYGLIMDGSTLRAVSASNNSSQNASISGLSVGVLYSASMVLSGSSITLSLNGQTATGSGATSPGYALCLFGSAHIADDFSVAASGLVYSASLWNAAKPVILQLSRNPGHLFEDETELIPFDVPTSGSPYSMDAEVGSYVLSGVDATFKASRTLVAEAGSYSLTGVAAGLSYGHVLTAEAGSYALTGVDATFKASRTILADAGSYVVSGQDATFTYTPVGSGSPYSMDADAGSYTLTGVAASFKASRTLVAEAGSYALTGVDASFTRSEYRLVAETGSYVISGQEAIFSTTGTVTPTGGRGGNGKGQNLSRKQKKKLKAVESQEWLKAEETARQLLNDRFTKQTPQEKAEALQTYVESLQPVIEALKALTTQVEEVAEVVEEIPVVELTPHQEILSRFDTLEKKLKSVEELVIILMADL